MLITLALSFLLQEKALSGVTDAPIIKNLFLKVCRAALLEKDTQQAH